MIEILNTIAQSIGYFIMVMMVFSLLIVIFLGD